LAGFGFFSSQSQPKIISLTIKHTNTRTQFFSKILITMLNIFDKKTPNTNCHLNTGRLNFFSYTANGINDNRIGETRHYPPATKE